ncbi:MAG: DUF2520 domain-containing protein [Flavobacterium sp.]|nr:DUF2520 domain-containing protein [Flavobacterium sp.]
MISVSIIGSGNVALHLITAISNSTDLELVQVYARQKSDDLKDILPSKIVANLSDLIPADLYIIAVSDNAIASLSNQLPFENRLVAHTSGSISIDDLNSKNKKAVFYPLQTFTKNKEINFKTVPVCIEAKTESDYEIINKIAHFLSKEVYKIDSNQRKALHVAAVFANNFVNHLYLIGNEVCKEHDINFNILKPLILETSNKILKLSPIEAQTGPAKRGDTETLNSHIDFLTNKNQIEIYKLLTKSIIDHGKKL